MGCISRAGESGKSTIIKQMKILHNGGFNNEEIHSYKNMVYSNVLQSIQAILNNLEKLYIKIEEEEIQREIQLIMQIKELEPRHFAIIQRIWLNNNIKLSMQYSNQFQLMDSASYFLDNIERISEYGYEPTNEDILRTRIKTTGIIETVFNVKDTVFKMIDVGGQRSERKKWVHCFQDVTSILYLVGLSEYDQKLAEDETENRMVEAINLFETVSNSHWFSKTAVILFLNKTDLFKLKLPISPLSTYFPDFQGDRFEDSATYFRLKFEALVKNKSIYTHFTCATDTTNIQFVMAAVNDILMENTLKDVGLL